MEIKKQISKDEINLLPLVRFEKARTVITEPEALEEALNVLRSEKVLGFDTETRAAFRKGQKFEISMLQLSTADHVYLIRLNHVDFGPALADLMADDHVIKAGVAVRDDIKGLQRLHGFEPGGFVEIADMAKKLDLKNFGLRSLTALVFGKRISKKHKMANWELAHLTEDQLDYAAMDAWLGYQLYFELQKRLDEKS